MAGRAATSAVIQGKCAISVNDPGHPAPSGWLRVPLTDVAELGTGHTPSRKHPEYWDGDVPWIGIRDASLHHGGLIEDTAQHVTELGLANSAARLLPKGTVCLSRTASVGYVVMMGRDMATSQDFVTWTCSGALDPKFLMYALLAEGRDIRQFGEGSTHTTIYFPEVKAFHIDLPPIAEQRRIVAKIDSLSVKSVRARDHLDHIPRLVEKYKQAVLTAAFRGELSPGRKATPRGRPHWKRTKIKDLIYKIAAGKNLRCLERPPSLEERGVVKVSAVTWGEFDPKAAKTLPSDFQPPERTRIRKGDFLISRANTLELVGAAVIVKSDPENLYLSDKVLRLEMKENHKHWLLWYLRSPQGRGCIENSATGNQLSMRNLSQEALSEIELPWPDFAEREGIVRRVEHAFDMADFLAKEASRARSLVIRLDQSLLDRAFRGELVPQDPNDEPASLLLERIRAERADGEPHRRGRRAKMVSAN